MVDFGSDRLEGRQLLIRVASFLNQLVSDFLYYQPRIQLFRFEAGVGLGSVILLGVPNMNIVQYPIFKINNAGL
ncbi:hypothetical protein FHS14_002211 [Paenibacillus baekrokdamisoli]|nr:hypothetical protein [Paenibacillus baekrokdamisoli]